VPRVTSGDPWEDPPRPWSPAPANWPSRPPSAEWPPSAPA